MKSLSPLQLQTGLGIALGGLLTLSLFGLMIGYGIGLALVQSTTGDGEVCESNRDSARKMDTLRWRHTF